MPIRIMGPRNIEYKVAATVMKKEGLVSDLSKEETVTVTILM